MASQIGHVRDAGPIQCIGTCQKPTERARAAAETGVGPPLKRA